MVAPRRIWLIGICIALGALGIAAAWIAHVNVKNEAPISAQLLVAAQTTLATQDKTTVTRGAYLALIGNCAGCHTAAGGASYAGGDGLSTPFGKVYGGNLTPDRNTGIGEWNKDHFWRAMHNGRSRDGRLLNPAFPYTNFTLLTREDSDALFTFLSSLPPVVQQNRPHELRAPFNNQIASGVWRALFFRAAALDSPKAISDRSIETAPDPIRTAQWNRGAYLVNGLGHCVQCHCARNLMGALRDGLALNGGQMLGHGWYAPSLVDPKEASLTVWTNEEAIRLLTHGVNATASANGPMAQVVSASLQYLTKDDAQAMVTYLKQLLEVQISHGPNNHLSGETPVSAKLSQSYSTTGGSLSQGKALYETHCAACHGEQGQGATTVNGKPAYPRLKANRAIQLAVPDNLIQIVLKGGYTAATAQNPQPFGMPPYSQSLNNEEIADVVSYIRSAWGNSASQVSAIRVGKLREGR